LKRALTEYRALEASLTSYVWDQHAVNLGCYRLMALRPKEDGLTFVRVEPVSRYAGKVMIGLAKA
jgi:hypothetical protein